MSENFINYFGSGAVYYLPKILPFLNEEDVKIINNMDFFDFENFMCEENYEKISKDAIYESETYFEHTKIKIYLIKKENFFIPIKKGIASHVLVQVFDEDDQLVSEELKEI